MKVSELIESNRSCTICIYNYVKYLPLKEFMITDYDNHGLKVNIKFGGVETLDEIGLGPLLTSNPHFEQLVLGENESYPMNAVIFKKEVLQYPSDNFFSPYGHSSILAEDLVKEFFVDSINCHTEV